jgi:hypothetical protein
MKSKVFKENILNRVVDGSITQFRELPVLIDCGEDHLKYIEADWQKEPMTLQCGSDGYYHCQYCGYGDEWLKPRFKVGDMVYLKESWYDPGGNSRLLYKREEPEVVADLRKRKIKRFWNTPITMYEDIANYFIEITNVKCERLQNVTDEDALKEGVEPLFTQEQCDTVVGIIGTKSSDHGYKNYLWHGHFNYGMGNKKSDNWYHQHANYDTPSGSFSSLVSRDYHNHIWWDNPYFFIYEFKKVNRHGS